MNSLAQDWLRALTSGLILADMIGQFCGGNTSIPGVMTVDWPKTWFATALAAGHGQVQAIVNQQTDLQQLEAVHPAAAALGLMPLSLTNPDIFSCCQPQLNLAASTWGLIDYLRGQLLGTLNWQILAPIPLFSPWGRPSAAPAASAFDPGLAAWVLQAETLHQSCLGNFSVAMECTVRLGDGLMLAWLGLLIAAQGLEQLPLGWRRQFLQGAELQSRWQLENEQAAWQLADGLSQSWLGRML